MRATGGVCTITLDNADKANSLTLTMLQDLRAAWCEAEEDPTVLAIVVEAKGDRHFCAGADVTMLRDEMHMTDAAKAMAMSSRQCGVTKPVVTAVTGNVVGGGLAIVADSDVVIASRNVTFTDPHVRHGQVCGYGAWRLAERMPIAEVVRMVLADVPITAERAHQVGFVAELHDSPGDVRTAAATWAEKVATHSPTAVRQNLGLLRKLARSSIYDDVIVEAQSAVREGREDEATANQLRAWSHSQD